MEIPLSTFEWALGGLLCVLVCLVAWVWSKLVESVGNLSVSVAKIKSDLSEHQLEAERRFARATEVNEKIGKLGDNIADIQKNIQGMNVSLATLAAVAQVKVPSQG